MTSLRNSAFGLKKNSNLSRSRNAIDTSITDTSEAPSPVAASASSAMALFRKYCTIVLR